MSMDDRREMEEALASLRSSLLHNTSTTTTTTPSENIEYTPEQHLVAAASKLRKMESSNQAAMDKLINALSSPFKIGTKRCENERAEVLRCYNGILRPATNTTNSTDSISTSRTGDATSSTAVKDMVMNAETVLELPLYQCWEAASRYERCVEEKVTARHLNLANAFRAEAEKEV